MQRVAPLTANFDRGFQLKQIGLRNEDLPRFSAEVSEVVLTEADLLARLLAAHLQQLVDHVVNLLVFRLHYLFIY